jgi:hypothetical protein
MRWEQGRAAIDGMLSRGELERVPPSREHADLLLGPGAPTRQIGRGDHDGRPDRVVSTPLGRRSQGARRGTREPRTAGNQQGWPHSRHRSPDSPVGPAARRNSAPRRSDATPPQ